MRKSVVISALMLLSSTAAWAGPQYVDETGYAVSGYDVVSYFNLEQAAHASEQPAPAPGMQKFVTTYNGVKFAFSSETNLNRFKQSPERFAPAFDGHCAYGVAKGGKVPGNPRLWRIVDGKLYLNITATVAEQWEADIPENLSAAKTNWPSLEGQGASTRLIPGFKSKAPLK